MSLSDTSPTVCISYVSLVIVDRIAQRPRQKQLRQMAKGHYNVAFTFKSYEILGTKHFIPTGFELRTTLS